MILSPKTNPPQFLEWGEISSDKSLSHRGVIFSFLTQGECEVENFLNSQDTLATLQIAQNLGARVIKDSQKISITPPKKINPTAQIPCQNSGTAMRLYAGLLSGVKGKYSFSGDESLSSRPMQRIKTPLELMGAKMSSNLAPFELVGSENLRGIKYASPISSAQVKSAFILASLFAKNPSEFSEPFLSRDHSERFLSFLNAPIEIEREKIKISPLSHPLKNFSIQIPNDPSSIIFFVIACLIADNQEMNFSNVLLNPTRIEAFEVLKRMGAKLEYKITQERFEPIGEVRACSSKLVGVEVSERIAWLIDELPALSIAFACASGESKVSGAKELRSKECDRIRAVVENLKTLGIQAYELEDGFGVVGGEFVEGRVSSFGDHRIAMSFSLVGVRKRVEIVGSECVDISFPRFYEFLAKIVEVKE